MQLNFRVLLWLLFFCTPKLYSQQHVSFSVQAHPDDWQLFMSNAIVKDLNNNDKVVFLTITAGDAGNGTIGWASPVPYYLARQNGSMLSAKFAADMIGGIPTPNPVATVVTVNAHNITRFIYKNTVNYFLNLPDGSGNGAGNAITGYQSLQRLKEGLIPAINAVDGSATYNSWADLTQTLMQIINNERSGDSLVWVYTPSLDLVANNGDHSDHLHSSIAIQDAAANASWVGISEFIDYASASLPANLTGQQHADAAAVFSLCVWGMTSARYTGAYDEGHKSWLAMEYFEIKRVPVYDPAAPPTAATMGNNRLPQSATGVTALTKIPIMLFVSNPTGNTGVPKIIVSALEPGQLVTQIFNANNIKVYETVTSITKKGLATINITAPASTPHLYTVKHVLNNRFYDAYTAQF